MDMVGLLSVQSRFPRPTMVLTSSLGPKGQGGVPLRVKIRSSQTPAGLVIRGARPPQSSLTPRGRPRPGPRSPTSSRLPANAPKM
jgi:hypothetical protein